MMRVKPTRRGFTLIELMVSLAVMVVALAIGVPGFRDMMARSTIASQTQSLVSSLNFSRSQAIANARVVTVYPSGGAGLYWSKGWLVFFDADSQGHAGFDSHGGDVLLRVIDYEAPEINIYANESAKNGISFNAKGAMLNALRVSITLCDAKLNSAIAGRLISINPVGRITVSRIAAKDKHTQCQQPEGV